MQLNINDFLYQSKQNPQLQYRWDSFNTLTPHVQNSNLHDEFLKVKNQSSISQKTVNFAKNLFKFSSGSKKVEQQLLDNNVSNENKKEALKKYEISQKCAQQNLGNIASSAAGLFSFWGIKKAGKYLNAALELGKIKEGVITSSINEINEKVKFANIKPESVIKFLKSNKAATAAAFGAAFLASGVIKQKLIDVDDLGSGKYKLDKEYAKTLDKKEKKAQKKELKKQKRKDRFKNFATGGINGVLAPAASLMGIAGIPLYGASSIGLNYLSTKDEDAKIKDVIKNSAFTTLLCTAVSGILLAKQGGAGKIFVQNMDEVLANLKKAKLTSPEFPAKNSYDELRDILYDAPEIKSILNGSESDVSKVINDLTEENIFAVKFKQIEKSGGGAVSDALKENCPPTRTIEEAQKTINKLLGREDFQVTKLLGVGTVAESYLAKGKDGSEVCIKILKDGISKEKILADKQKFVQLVTKGKPVEQLSENQQYLLRNIDNLADSILKEVDFKNEMLQAQHLKKYTKLADVVVPVEAKEGVYVMQKAPGISLDSLSKYYSLQNQKKWYSNTTHIDRQIAELKAKCPDFEDFDLSNKEVEKILKQYIDVYTEQFNKVESNGKVLHADIHPGNIFINVDALKSGKGKIFTLIDTGNTINMTGEQAQRAIKLSSYVKNGNSKDIAKYVTESAILPEGMNQADAVKKVEEELKKVFFDYNTELNSMTNDSVIDLTSGIMRKYGIIPNDNQLNLCKAKTSASNSLDSLIETFFGKKYADADMENKAKAVKNAAGIVKDMASIQTKSAGAKTIQETKNLLHMKPKDALAQIKNPNMIKTNSKEYITYKLKQMMPKEANFDKFLS